MNTTLVRHSAWTVARDPRFEHAVETRSLLNRRDINNVEKAGGIILPSREAYEREHEENYPPEVKGMIPHVRGTFSKLKVDGSQIYIPKPSTDPI